MITPMDVRSSTFGANKPEKSYQADLFALQ